MWTDVLLAFLTSSQCVLLEQYVVQERYKWASKGLFIYAICIILTSSKWVLIAYDFLLLISTASWENSVLQIFLDSSVSS